MAPRSQTEKDEALYVETVRSFLNVFRYLRQYSRQVHESGRSGRQLSTLRYLAEQGESTMGSLSRYLYINESSTSELVAKLEAAGHVSRTRSKADNRVVLVCLTPSGRKLALDTEVGGVPLLRERLKTLQPAELSRIKESFDSLHRLLDIPEDL